MLVYHCVTDKLRMLRMNLSAGAQTHENRLLEIGLKAGIDEGKDVQARINDR